jgi:hypothetical protein
VASSSARKSGIPPEERGPVLLDLLPTTEAAVGMGRLLAPVIRVEAGEEFLQVVLVHGTLELIENFPGAGL